jgi:hypothetical protein
MSRFQSLRLAQFWRIRLEPLITTESKGSSLYARQVFEAVGWLIEGAFCGFFDLSEADAVWTQFRPVVEACQNSEDSKVSETVPASVKGLLASSDAFPVTDQMTDGPQKKFELPLFSQGLLLADRLAADDLANACTDFLYSVPEDSWKMGKDAWPSVDSDRVVSLLNQPFASPLEPASLLAGYLRLLEHMDASRCFFQHAKERSTKKTDFDSYCQRIGGLNGWRIPLADFDGARQRFEELPELLEFAVRHSFQEELPNADWSNFESPFNQHLKSLIEAWETYNLAAFLVAS